MAEKGRLLTGARALFSIDGVKVGYATSVSITETVNYEDVEVLDNIEDEEHVPIGYKIENFTASRFKIIGETLKSLSWFPKTGANVEEHLENILSTGDLVATLEDTKTGKLFATVEQVKVQSQNYTVNARGIVGEDISFKAIRLKDESEI